MFTKKFHMYLKLQKCKNSIEIGFQTSKMTTGDHFEKKKL